MSELELTVVAARLHAENTRLEIDQAMTRQEHIRMTRLALEADEVAKRLEKIVLGVAV